MRLDTLLQVDFHSKYNAFYEKELGGRDLGQVASSTSGFYSSLDGSLNFTSVP